MPCLVNFPGRYPSQWLAGIHECRFFRFLFERMSIFLRPERRESVLFFLFFSFLFSLHPPPRPLVWASPVISALGIVGCPHVHVHMGRWLAAEKEIFTIFTQRTLWFRRQACFASVPESAGALACLFSNAFGSLGTSTLGRFLVQAQPSSSCSIRSGSQSRPEGSSCGFARSADFYFPIGYRRLALDTSTRLIFE